MCVIVRVNGRWCETVSELADAVGTAAAGILPEAFVKYEADSCLCGIDFVAMGARPATEKDGTVADWIIQTKDSKND